MKWATGLLLLSLAACGQQAEPQGNAAEAENVVENASAQCAPPALAFPDGDQSLQSEFKADIKASFGAAYDSACRKGVLKDRMLIDPMASDQGKLFLVNAPVANVASIHLSQVDGNRMVLEYPFLTTDGKTHVPSADELGEAIYCAVVGATPEEQESSGRCLVD